jgi:hypothetical protein
LFDTKRFTRNVETLYMSMWQRYLERQPPTELPIAGQ